MPYRQEVFVEQLPLVDLFVKHLIHYRLLKPWLARAKVKSSFWSDTSNAHLLQAIIYWCKVFGSDRANPTHWKKLSSGDCEEIQKSFLAGLYSSLCITPAEWQSYWEEVLSFRNKYVAHHELEHSQPVPILDLALEAAYYYDDWIRKTISPDMLCEKPLRELVEQLLHDVEEDLSTAMHAFATEQKTYCGLSADVSDPRKSELKQ